MTVSVASRTLCHEWIQTRHSSQIEKVVEDLSKQYLSSEHGALQKAVSDLSSRIDKLQPKSWSSVGRSKQLQRHRKHTQTGLNLRTSVENQMLLYMVLKNVLQRLQKVSDYRATLMQLVRYLAVWMSILSLTN